MKLSELIAAVGDDVVQFQNLDQDAYSLNYNAKSGTKISFATSEAITTEGTAKLGLVIWLPRDAVNAAIAKAKEPSHDQ